MKKTYLLGSMILGIIALLAVIITLSATGVLGSSELKPLVISTQSAEGRYDGNPLTNSGWKLESGELEEGHKIVAKVYGSQTDAGTSENSISVKIIDENQADVTEEYALSYKLGKLTVTPRPITITSGSASKQYDGTPISCESYQIVGGTLLNGHALSVEYGMSRTEVGVSENIISARVVNDKGRDVTANYKLDVLNGSLTITGYPIAIATPSKEGVYNGLPLQNNAYEVLSGELKNGDTMVVTVLGSQTNVGTSENDFSIQIFSTSGEDVTGRYEITKELGTLTVTPRDIKIETEGKSVVYNMEDLVHNVYNVYGSLGDGHTALVNVTGKVVGVGEADNTFYVEIVDGSGNVVTDNYNIDKVCGKLQVLPVDIVITSSNATKEYDGTPLTSPDYDLSIGRLFDGHLLVVTVTGERTLVGASENTFIYEILDVNGNNVSEFYDVEPVYGKLEITPIRITLSTNGDVKYYDGTPLTVNGEGDWWLSEGTLFNGHTLFATIIGTQTNAGFSYNELEYTVYDEEGRNVTDCYEVEKNYGILEVLPIKLSIKTGSDFKPFDGTPLTKDECELLSGSVLDGHSLVMNAIGTVTLVGKVENNLFVSITDSEGNDVTSNYEVEELLGELEVLPIELAISTGSDSKIYDGTPLRSDTYELTGGTLFEGHSLTVTVNGSIINAGSAPNDFTYAIYDQNGGDVTSVYNVLENPGTLTVEKLEITVKTGSANKYYDGTPLECHEYEIVAGELLSGHQFNINYISSIVNAEVANNMFTYTVTDEYGVDVTGNYRVMALYGELRIDPKRIVVYTGSAKKYYDGTPITCDEWELKEGELLEGHTLEVVPYGQRTEVGISSNTALVYLNDENGANVRDNYSLSFSTGNLEILPIVLSVTSMDSTKMYDGTPLRYEEYKVTRGSLLDGHVLNVVFNSFPVLAGTHENKIEVIITDEDGLNVSKCYEINKTYGSLVITPRTVTVRTESDQKPYDGTPLTNDGYIVVSQTDVITGHTLVVVISGTQTEIGKSPNYIAEIHALDENGQDMSLNYDFTRSQEGTLTVTDPSLNQGGGSGDGSGGGGSGDGGDTGNIPDTENMDPPPTNETESDIIGYIKPTASGNIYLREMSFRDYDFKNNVVGSSYEKLIDSTYSMNYLTSFAIKNSKMVSDEMKIRYESTRYFLPYYLDTAVADYKIQTSDIAFVDSACEELTLYYYNTWYNGTGTVPKVPSEYASVELEYREHVYKTYMDVPTKTKAYLDGIIASEGFSKNDSEIIKKVIYYIQNCATYNLNNQTAAGDFAAEDDAIIAFMDVYKEGVCRHFAASATYLLRALGIPARYTVGILVQGAVADEWNEVNANKGHAWTEVYIDGTGWVAIDVTPGGDNGTGDGDDGGLGGGNESGGNEGGGNEDGGNEGGGNESGGNEDGGNESGGNESGGNESGGSNDDTIKFEMWPNDQSMLYYEGAVLNAVDSVTGNDAYKMLVNNGYTFTYDISGTQTEVGYGQSIISNLKIFDPDGVDITDQCAPVIKPGKLHMYQYELNVSSHSYGVYYTGEYVSYEHYSSSGLLEGHTLTVKFVTKKRDAGSYDNYYTCQVLDKDGKDVSYIYKINRGYGKLNIFKIDITLEADSTSMSLDELNAMGGIYYATEWEMTSGELLDGHTIDVTLDGYIDDCGRCDSYIVAVSIKNADGEDVTRNYNITYVDGEMSVRP